jgi:short-subunit dehydrogenase
MATALVTGASSGIGRELARVFARNGHGLVLAARRVDELNALAAELRDKFKVPVACLRADLATTLGPQKLFDDVTAAGLTVDMIVNNAGFGLLGPFMESDGHRLREMLDVNVSALTRLTRLFLPGMVGRKVGWVLNVASTAAFQPGPLMAAYYATKAYVLSLSEALAYELRDTGVTVTCLCPGPTATEFSDVAGATKTKLFKKGRLMTATAVAEAGYAGLMAGKRVVIPGFQNRLLARLSPFLPRALTSRIVERYQQSK